MKKYIYSMAIAATFFSAASCSDEVVNGEVPVTPEGQKEQISFSMSDGSASSGTRAFSAEGLTRAGFDGNYGSNSSQNTQILMHIESKNGSKWKFTKTQAVAEPQASGKNYSEVSFPEDYRRYWDDAHGRNSKLSIYAVAIPNLSSISSSAAANNAVIEEGDLASAASGQWGTDLDAEPSHTIQWTVSKAQNTTTLYSEDLVYSNNIQADSDLGKDGRYWFDFTSNTWNPGTATDITKTGDENVHGNGCMQFLLSNSSDPTSAGKFDRGHLKFNHALSRITIKLVEGTGFDHTSSTTNTDFNFDDAVEANRTINLYQMNYTGTLNIKTGKWATTDESKLTVSNPVRIAPGSKSNTTTTEGEKTIYTSGYTCSAQILPDYVLEKSKVENVLDFTIDGNTYYIQNKMLWKALNDNAGTGSGQNGLAMADSYTMQQGKNYIFTITVDKKQIESLTATLAPWSEVEGANEHINNTHVEFTTYEASGSKVESGLHLFRLPENLGSINTTDQPDAIKYRGAYTDEATTSYADSKWSTNWFFEDNKTAYHFRSLNTLACVGSTDNTNHDATGSETNKKQSNFGTTSATVYSETRSCTYFNMFNGSTTNADYQWGAPLIVAAGTKYYEYSTSEGFEALLHKGITSTESTINITQLHMMSQINVIVRTTDKCYGASGNESPVDASNAIALETGTTGSEVQCDVTLTRLYNHGTVDMGTGLISIDKETSNETPKITSGVKSEEPMTKPSAGVTPNNETGDNRVIIDGKKYSTKKTGEYTFNVIPQELKRGSATDTDESYYVGITIKTPDNNQYYVVKRLSEILATSVGTSQNQTAGSADANKITRWYPNHKYIYTFTITKKGIESITCTLADWSEVKAADTPIDLES